MKKNVLVLVIVALMVGVGTSEGATIIYGFQDLMPLQGPGDENRLMRMDIDWDTGELDNLMSSGPGSSADFIVGMEGVYRIAFYNEFPGGYALGAFANNDNWVADTGPEQAGWMKGYAYDNVFFDGSSPDGALLVFDPDGGQMALKYIDGRLKFDADVSLYWANGIEFDGVRGDLSSIVFTFGPRDVIRIPHLVILPPGDTNGDDIVDDFDYDNLVEQFGGVSDVESADFNSDGRVDLADFAILRGNFGFGVGSAPVVESTIATPEPATMTLLGCSVFVLLRRKRGVCRACP